jgi:hypothetical protein
VVQYFGSLHVLLRDSSIPVDVLSLYVRIGWKSAPEKFFIRYVALCLHNPQEFDHVVVA